MQTAGLLIMFFGGSLALLIAMGVLVRPFRIKNLFLSSMSLCVGIWQLYICFLYSNLVLDYPYLYNFMGPFVFFTGPLFYLYLTFIIDDSYNFRAVWIWHFIPGVLCAAILFPYTYIFVTDHYDEFVLIRKLGLVGPIKPFLFAAIILDGIYTVLLIRKLSYIWRREYFFNSRMVHILILLIITLIMTLIFFVCVAFESETIGRISGVMVTLTLIYIYMLSEKYPDLIRYLAEETQKKHYERSQISKLDLGDMQKRLIELMEVEKVFRDEELNLKRMAERLNITSHQLSEYLNERLGTNFKSYLKIYRVEEAKKLLLEKSETTILAIGMEVGFNSNSAFHAAFRQEAGMTPIAYRKNFSRKS